jgi:hypothetical protein
MFQVDQIAQAFAGPLAHDALMQRCSHWLARIARGGDKEIFENTVWLAENPLYLEEWKVYQAGVLELVSDQSTVEGQIRKLREIILAGLEIASNASFFAGNTFTQQEKQALKARIDPEVDTAMFQQLQKQGRIFAAASVDCGRCLAREFGDMQIQGWSEIFASHYAAFAERLLRALLADSSLSVDRLQGTALESGKLAIESLKVAILKGSKDEFEQVRQSLEAGGER